jgi:hypothetical protein
VDGPDVTGHHGQTVGGISVPLSSQDVSTIVDGELRRFKSATSRDEFRKLFRKPYRQERKWDWNNNQLVPVWVVAEREGALVVYSRDGYEDPWGWVSASDRLLGMDAQWHSSLEFAFLGSRKLMKSTTFPASVRSAHAHSSGHREELLASSECGCFYCETIYPPTEIAEWVDADASGVGQTALCPRCGVDSVIGDKCDFPITPDFLAEMKRHWF